MAQQGVNKLIVLGYVGSDAELKFTAGGKPVANFSVAVNESFKNSNGDNVDRAEWFRCVAWNGLAEVCGQYVREPACNPQARVAQTRAMNHSFLDLLKKHKDFGGLDAPIFAWCAAVLLVVTPVSILVFLWWRVRRESRTPTNVTKSIEELWRRVPVTIGHGLSSATYERVVQI